MSAMSRRVARRGAAAPERREPARASRPQALGSSNHALLRAQQAHAAIRGGGAPLDRSTRARAQGLFGEDLGDVRVHTGREAAASAARVSARAYTVGRDVVFGDGQFAPGTAAGQRLIAHELTHVVQQRGHPPVMQRQTSTPEEIRAAIAALERRAAEPVSMSPAETAALVEQRHALLNDLAVATRGRALSGPALPPAPGVMTGAGGASAMTAAAAPAATMAPVPPEQMVEMIVTQRNFSAGTPTTIGGEAPYTPADFASTMRGRAAGPGYQTNAVVQVIDANGSQAAFELAQYGGGGEPHAEAQAVARLRMRLANGSAAGGRMIVAVDQLACGGCLARLRALAVELRLIGFEVWVPDRGGASPKWVSRSATIQPARPAPVEGQSGPYRMRPVLAQAETIAPPTPAPATPPSAPPVRSAGAAASPPETTPARPAPVEPTAAPRPATEPAVAPEAAAARPGAAPRSAWRGTGGGLLSIGVPIIMGFIHQNAVRDRIREQAAREGSVPVDAPSGEGLLYDIGAWFIDPTRSAESSVGSEDRINVPVWRARIRAATSAVPVGGTFRMHWQVGQCERDILGHQVIEDQEVTYRKQADGQWIVEEGNAEGTPNLNRLIAPDVSDDQVRRAITSDPCPDTTMI